MNNVTEQLAVDLDTFASDFDSPNSHKWDTEKANRLIRLCRNASMMNREDREDFLENIVYDALTALIDAALDSLPLPLKAEDVSAIIANMAEHVSINQAEDLVKTAVECAYTSQSENAYLRFSFARPDWRGEK